jgi:hypothetical protein
MPGVDHMLPDKRTSAERTDLVVYVNESIASTIFGLMKAVWLVSECATNANLLEDGDHEFHARPAASATITLYDGLMSLYERLMAKRIASKCDAESW